MRNRFSAGKVLTSCCRFVFFWFITTTVTAQPVATDATRIGMDIYHQFLSDHPPLTVTDNVETETVNRVAGLLIESVKKYYGNTKKNRELDGFQWETHLFALGKADAWCLPGGKIAVYAPMLSVTQSEASLAVVMGHAIAHVLLKHGDARMKQYLKEFLDKKDLSTALAVKPRETRDFYRMAYGNGDYVGVIKGFSVQDEMAADELGAIFCAGAGYHPAEALVFLERMYKLEGTGRQPEWSGTHPVSEKRISYLQDIMDALVQKYYKPIIKK